MIHYLRSPEVGLLLATLLALAILVAGLFLRVPEPVAFAAAFALFLFPGALISLVLLGDRLPLPAHAPVAFTLSAGLFGLLGLPALVLHWNPSVYLSLAAGAFAAALVFAGERVRERLGGSITGPEAGLSPNWLWVPFLAAAGLLAYLSAVKVKQANEDIWVYLTYVREFYATDRLAFYYPYTGEEAPFSRLTVNGWLLVQSALAQVSGLDPVDLVLDYLGPVMILLALLAVYAVARVLLQSDTAALLAGTLAGLFFLVYMSGSLFTPGGEFIGRVAEDKYVARFFFLPTAVIVGAVFVRERRLDQLALFTFVCWSVAAIHPMGVMFIAIAVGGFGVFHLLANLRSVREWPPVAHLGVAVLSIGLPPGFFLLATGNPLLNRLATVNPATRDQLLDTWQRQGRLMEIGAGSYIADPSLFTNPGILAAYAVGVPFLVWSLRRGSVAARWLLGTMVFPLALIYVPPIATLIGDRVGPWLLFRLAWPAYLAATVALGWALWELLRFGATRLERRGPGLLRNLAPFVPLVFVVVLAAVAAPWVTDGARAVDREDEVAQDQPYCPDPVFRWLGGEVSGPSVVLAPDVESGCVTAYAREASIVSFRGRLEDDAEVDQIEDEGSAPANTRFVQDFYSASVVGQDTLRNVQRREVDYVLLPVHSALKDQLVHLPGFTELDTPGERYRVYRVNRQEIAVDNPLVRANSWLRIEENLEQAESLYNRAIRQGTESERFLAGVGLGRLYLREERYAEAALALEQALEVNPESPDTYAILNRAYVNLTEFEAALEALERAVELEPRQVNYRLQLASLEMWAGDSRNAIAQYRQILEMYPNVPIYRVGLGSALNWSGDHAAADAEFERAVSLNPLSAELHADVANAHRRSGRLEEATAFYERAVELNSTNATYNYELGAAYADLSVTGGRDEDYFELAVETLERAMELENADEATRLNARLRLGDLYRDWDRPEQAREAYERALEIDPESALARDALEQLER
jgi:tetratricopeptide (TPR) repeat protein